MSDKEVEELKEQLNTLEENPFGVPFDPVDLLQECLYHSEDEIRVRALRLAGSFPTADFIEPLFRIVAESDNLEVRITAIQTLGQFLHQGRMVDLDRGDREALPDDFESDEPMSGLSRTQFSAVRDFLGELVRQVEWPPELRAEALPHFARLAPEEAKSLISQFYRGEKVPLQRAALKAVSRLESGDWAHMISGEVSREGDVERRLLAVEAAGVHGVDEVGPELVRILRNHNRDELRQAAAEALGRIPWSRAAEHLEEFCEDRDPVVRERANEGLIRQHGELGDDVLNEL